MRYFNFQLFFCTLYDIRVLYVHVCVSFVKIAAARFSSHNLQYYSPNHLRIISIEQPAAAVKHQLKVHMAENYFRDNGKPGPIHLPHRTSSPDLVHQQQELFICPRRRRWRAKEGERREIKIGNIRHSASPFPSLPPSPLPPIWPVSKRPPRCFYRPKAHILGRLAIVVVVVNLTTLLLHPHEISLIRPLFFFFCCSYLFFVPFFSANKVCARVCVRVSSHMGGFPFMNFLRRLAEWTVASG